MGNIWNKPTRNFQGSPHFNPDCCGHKNRLGQILKFLKWRAVKEHLLLMWMWDMSPTLRPAKFNQHYLTDWLSQLVNLVEFGFGHALFWEFVCSSAHPHSGRPWKPQGSTKGKKHISTDSDGRTYYVNRHISGTTTTDWRSAFLVFDLTTLLIKNFNLPCMYKINAPRGQLASVYNQGPTLKGGAN